MTDSPLLVKLSGGRSSGRMLRLLLDDGRFVVGRDFAVFTNTGAEHPATLEFLHRIETEWKVPIVWLEYDRDENRTPKESFRVVDFVSAARDGRPFFEAMTAGDCAVIPNSTARVCTAKLKVAVSDRWQAAMGFDDPIIALGYRKGEESRRARALARDGDKRLSFPLIDAGIDNAAVVQWWREQPFDLDLPTEAGRTKLGNCVGCFLKGERALMEIFAECPSRANFWIRLEDELERKRNQPQCRWWLNRHDENSAWSRIPPPVKPDANRHRQDADGDWWQHDGRWHRVTLNSRYSYRQLRDMAVAGVHKRGKRTRDADMFLDSPNPGMPCECGD